MAAYVVVDVTSADPVRAAEYRAISGPSVERHGGRFLARGGVMRVLEGDWAPERLVVIEVRSLEAAGGWFRAAGRSVGPVGPSGRRRLADGRGRRGVAGAGCDGAVVPSPNIPGFAKY